ncbi:hypothetical protein [Fundidesulfovibrio terrae]|uniref:hypothetical protein n=1 Tax=Fundidesulfovibrio terrae TaxID=2922866 RepID=UPI001FAEE031
MEKVLVKLARQLNNFDEASLTSMWERYAEQVKRFEPSKRWEEAVLILSMIQAVRFKNQLFNLNWSEGRTPGETPPPKQLIEAVPNHADPQPEKPKAKTKGKVLSFKSKDEPGSTE